MHAEIHCAPSDAETEQKASKNDLCNANKAAPRFAMKGKARAGRAFFRLQVQMLCTYGLSGGVRSPERTLLRLHFPALRENTGNFAIFDPLLSLQVANQALLQSPRPQFPTLPNREFATAYRE